MKNMILDFENMHGRENTHVYLAQMLGFPEYYGKNLDALYDCLTELTDCTVSFSGVPQGYGERVLEVFRDAAQANPGLMIEIR